MIEESGPIPFDGRDDDLYEQDPTTAAAINARFARGTQRMARLEQELKRNTEATEANGIALAQNNEMTREMYEVWAMAKSGLEAIAKLGRGLAITGRWIARAVKWLTPIVVGIVAIYHAVDALLHGTGPK